MAGLLIAGDMEENTKVFELVKAGGWLMLPIIACSVIAMAIVIERLWMLRSRNGWCPGTWLHKYGKYTANVN